MRRMYEENIWRLTYQEIDNLMIKYGPESENKLVRPEDNYLIDKLQAVTKIIITYIGDNYTYTYYCPIIYYSENYTNDKLALLNKSFGSVEFSLNANSYGAGYIIGFSLTEVQDSDGTYHYELSVYTDEL